MAEYANEAFAPLLRRYRDLYLALNAGGYATARDALEAHPEWGDLDLAAIASLLQEGLDPGGETVE
jgi:hypothetical protein